MSKTIIKTSLRGFTLIELLVVIAIIGLLSTAIMGPVQTGLKKGRDTRKISDLTQIEGALLQYAGDNNGTYPVWLAYDAAFDVAHGGIGFASSTLASTTPTYMKPDDKMLPSKSAERDRFAYVVYSDTAGNIVGYHLGVALENQNASLQGDADCQSGPASAAGADVAGEFVTAQWGKIASGDVSSSGAPSCNSLSSGALFNTNAYIALTGGAVGNNGTTPATDPSGALSKQEDFGGKGSKEAANDVCSTKLNTCIFDVVPH